MESTLNHLRKEVVSNLNPEIPPEGRGRFLSPLEWETNVGAGQQYTMNLREIVELLYFFYQTGYISREFHDPVHALKFELEIILDRAVPGWQPSDLAKLVKEARGE